MVGPMPTNFGDAAVLDACLKNDSFRFTAVNTTHRSLPLHLRNEVGHPIDFSQWRNGNYPAFRDVWDGNCRCSWRIEGNQLNRKKRRVL